MPLQNRVAPDGTLHAVPERGTMLGNRGGKFHTSGKTLRKRRWATHHWICCELHFKDMHHDAMGRGYTSLFFLDEVTALAAGHRPCFFCRRKEALAFLAGEKVEHFDRRVHGERCSSPRSAPQQKDAHDVADGTMFTDGTSFFAKRGERLLRWSFAGYTLAQGSLHLNVLTPPSITAILARGYQPRWHVSALQWDNS